MDTYQFLEYLHEHRGTAPLAESLTDVVRMRRALADRRRLAAARQMLVMPAESHDRVRVAS